MQFFTAISYIKHLRTHPPAFPTSGTGAKKVFRAVKTPKSQSDFGVLTALFRSRRRSRRICLTCSLYLDNVTLVVLKFVTLPLSLPKATPTNRGRLCNAKRAVKSAFMTALVTLQSLPRFVGVAFGNDKGLIKMKNC
jgi:hypothetical protein